MIRIIVILLAVLLNTACSTKTIVRTPDNIAPLPSVPDCSIEFVKKEKVNFEFLLLGEIESHIKRNFFFGGSVSFDDEAKKELKVKACKLGANTIIVDGVIESKASEMSHVHVWARAVKK